MVRPIYKATVGILLSLAMLFSAIGFAELSGDLLIDGVLEYESPSGIFITNVEVLSETNVRDHDVSFVKYTTTVESTMRRRSSTGKVVYRITVFNNTQYDYAYRGLFYNKSDGANGYVLEEATSNSKLGISVKFPNDDRVVPSKQERTFEVTYTAGSRIGTNVTLGTILNYQFGINVTSLDKASDIVHSKFLEILNNSTTYIELLDVLDDKFDGRQEWTSNYVGNVGNAVNNDMLTVETLFAGHLTMMINGKPNKAWVLIKHENLDGNLHTGDDYTAKHPTNGGVFNGYGCEMTLYMTTDKLETSGKRAPVYVTVFSCDRGPNGERVGGWYKVGDTYYGHANVVGYNGESNGTGSFVTDNWLSYNETYSPTSNYSYNIDANGTIKDISRAVDPKAVTAFQELLRDAEDIINDDRYAGIGISDLTEIYRAASKFYTIDAEGRAIATQNVSRSWLIPTMTDLDQAITSARDKIAEIEGTNP